MAPERPLASLSTLKMGLEADSNDAPAKLARKTSKMPPPSFSNPSEMVTFLVGKEGEEETFKVHKEFACYYSPVLYAAFNSNFEEGQTQTYRLSDTAPGVFRLLVRWLYSQNLTAPSATGSDEEEEEKLEKLKDIDLVHLWVVADRLLIRRLQNCTIRTLDRMWYSYTFNSPRFPSMEWIRCVYEHTAPGSPLRKLAVDLCMWGGIEDQENEEKFRENLPPELFFDIFKVFGTSLKGVEGDDHNIVDENGKVVQAHDNELFFHGMKFDISRIARNYLVPEDD